MRKISILIACLFVSFSLMGQLSPDWLDASIRMAQYPKNSFLTGFAEGNVNTGENIEKAVERIKTTAQSNLLESIRVNMRSNTASSMETRSSGNTYDETETFSNRTSKSVAAEITGMKVESYLDRKNNYIYAFAYANKFEVVGFYKANLSLLINQVESGLQTAENLERNGEKAKARKECEGVFPHFDKIREAQNLLTALSSDATNETLQVEKSEALRNSILQMQARLSQAVYVFIESEEEIFGERCNIVTNKLKALLAVNGCSFVDDAAKADFTLTISATTRELNVPQSDFVFAYADVVVDLFDHRKQKSIYHDEISKKSGSNTVDRAARKAMEDAPSEIIEKVKKFINN